MFYLPSKLRFSLVLRTSNFRGEIISRNDPLLKESLNNALPRKIIEWIVHVRENFSVNKGGEENQLRTNLKIEDPSRRKKATIVTEILKSTLAVSVTKSVIFYSIQLHFSCCLRGAIG